MVEANNKYVSFELREPLLYSAINLIKSRGRLPFRSRIRSNFENEDLSQFHFLSHEPNDLRIPLALDSR
jgi:hypothetical protein